MKLLQNLVLLHEQNKSPYLINWLNSNPKRKVIQLYHGIAKGVFINDVQASFELYGTVSEAKYRQIKRTLKLKLIEFSFYMPITEQDTKCSALQQKRNDFLRHLLTERGFSQEIMLEIEEIIASPDILLSPE